MAKESSGRKVAHQLWNAGFEAYFAGGCVRDRLRGETPKDFDIATNATPDQVIALFAKTIPVGVQFGVVLVIEEGETFEIATFRSDGPYKDGRHPDTVTFSTLEEDAKRRDFTVNGMYLDPRSDRLIDLVGGQADLTAKVIRTIGNAESRFDEDHLRMLRAVRFSAQLNFQIRPECMSVIQSRADDILKMSRERIRDEVAKILTGPSPGRGFRLLDESGLLKIIFPEMEKMKGVEQPAEYHPEGDVFVHTLLLLDQLKHASIELGLGALLHDVAKPATFERAVDRIRFHGHDRIGAQMSREICKRLAFSNEVTDLVEALVMDHLKFKDVFQMRLSTLKRFLSSPRFDLHLELHRIDCNASHGKMDAYDFSRAKIQEFSKLPPPPIRMVKGEDLIALGYRPGPQFSSILRAVEDAILEGELIDKSAALEWVKRRFPEGRNP